MTKKGLYKLITKPHIFTRDYLRKKQHKMAYILPKRKVIGQEKYTVVSAVYGVEKYLDDYFKSLIYQTLDFKKHIFLVLVDDGSLDNSANIIKKWQKRYPNNILYLKKENGGQASARNHGLDYLKTEWVTFIDPDDFVSLDYFENIDKLLQKDKHNNIGMIACRWKIFHEKNNRFDFNHPLDFRFKDGDKIIEHKKDKKFLPSSVATTFYRTSIIGKFSVKFDERIKPNFEDGYFSGKYFLYMEENHNKILYASKSLYIYRKRATNDSTLTNSWNNKNRFDTVLKDGYLGLINDEINKERIPYAIQRQIMYDMVWYFKKIINNPQSISFLTKEEKQKFKQLVYKVFEKIDKDVIMSFELAGFWFFHKVGFLGMLKNDKPDFNIIYIDDYDESKNLVRLRYFYYGNLPLEEFLVDNRYTVPIYEKVRTHYFIDDIFAKERIVWLDISNANESIYLNLFNEDTRINLNEKAYKGRISISDIRKFGKKKINIKSAMLPLNVRIIRKTSKSGAIEEKYKDCYVIMDRDTQADDNAEHFYRYLKENHTELKIFFVLSQKSHDYKRLKEDGFNLLPFDSLSHKHALLNAKYLISSHADKYVVDYMKAAHYRDMLNYKFIFLQHGVIRDDISTWLNNKNIDAFITSMPSEYHSIAKDSKYKFTDKEVVLTGLARHDRLVEREEPTEKVILIMPTWRNSLVGDLKNMSAKRDVTDEFYNSEYAQHWKSVLHSTKLKELVTKYDYKVVFFPHVNMSIYIDWFDAPSWIEVRTHKTDPILHKLFRRTKVMITDYSSVFFEMAILKKAILYYQFDFEYMYGGNHSSQLGYFDFEKDGFGAVSYREEELFINLEKVLENNGEPSDIYLERMISSLPFRDGKNRERTYEVIIALDKPYNEKIDKLSLQSSIDKAYKNEKWKLVESLYEKLEDKNDEYRLMLVESKLNLGQIEEANEIFEIIERDDLNLEKISESKEKLYNFILLSNEEQALLVNKNMDFFATLKFDYIKKLFNNKKYNVCAVAFELFDIANIPENKESEFYYMWGRTLRVTDRKEEALEKLAKSLSYNDREPNSSLWEYASTLYEVYDQDEIDRKRVLSIFKENDYEVNNIEYKLIKTWFEKKYTRQVAVAFALFEIGNIPENKESEFYCMWGKVLFEVNQFRKSIEKLKLSCMDSKEVEIMLAKSLVNEEQWEEAYLLWKDLYNKYPSHNKIETLKHLILSSIKFKIDKKEIQVYSDELLKIQFLTTSLNDAELIERLK